MYCYIRSKVDNSHTSHVFNVVNNKMNGKLIAPQASPSEQYIYFQVSLHQYTEDPTLAWEMLKEKRPVKPVRQMRLDTPVKPDHVRFVCIGCTHGEQFDISKLPPGDVLLVAGDFTSCGLPNEVHNFNKLLGKLKYSYKVVIGGNHECTFDDTFLKLSKFNSNKPLTINHHNKICRTRV